MHGRALLLQAALLHHYPLHHTQRKQLEVSEHGMENVYIMLSPGQLAIAHRYCSSPDSFKRILTTPGHHGSRPGKAQEASSAGSCCQG